jgi:hypothetical protein
MCSSSKQAKCPLPTEHAGGGVILKGLKQMEHRARITDRPSSAALIDNTICAPNPVITRTFPQMA